MKADAEELAKANKMKRKLPLQCRVEGCGADLAPLKLQNKADYRVRYKICDDHLKALEVPHEGKMMRFCQQCTSLHEVSCFDGNKRSCRVRLSSHNSRRRKKRQPGGADGAKGGAAGGGAAPAAPGGLGLDALQSLATLTGGNANNAVLSKIYELLAANNALPASPAKAPELADPNSAQLLKSAADMLGSMGATGVQSAVAALQTKPAVQQPAQAAPSVEQLNELLGTYSQLINLQQQGAAAQQPDMSALLPTSSALQQQRPADQAGLLANLASSGLLGAAAGGSPQPSIPGGLASAIAQQLSQFASGLAGNN